MNSNNSVVATTPNRPSTRSARRDAAIAARAGVSGFQQTQEALEVVSQQKAEVDETKGKTLEEISSVVEEINTKIKSQKAQLAPQIKELRTLRAKCQEEESEYLV